MEDIIKQCKGSIYLEINQYKNLYETIEKAIEEENSLSGDEEIGKELAERMIKENMFISLQFYPNSPIGFYRVYGTSLEEVINKAKKCLANN